VCKFRKTISEEFKLLKVELYYLRKRIKWLEKKAGIKCPHCHLEYLDNNQIACEDCGRVWDRWNVLSE